MEHWAENLIHARIPLHSSRLRQIQNLYLRFSLPLTDSSLFHLWKTGYSNFAHALQGTTTKSTRQRWSVFPHKFKLPRTEGRLVDYTIYCYVLPWSWLSPVHVIHWFHVRRIPDPWLHIAYLIVLWFSHALFGRKLVWSVCPQLCNYSGWPASFAARQEPQQLQDEALLSFSRQGCEHLSHTCIYHHSTQHKELDHTPIAANVPPLCVPFVFSDGRRCHEAPPGSGQHWGDRRTLRGTQGLSMKFWRKVG